MCMKKITLESPEAHSADLIAENIEKLKAQFPVDRLCFEQLAVKKGAKGEHEDTIGGRK